MSTMHSRYRTQFIEEHHDAGRGTTSTRAVVPQAAHGAARPARRGAKGSPLVLAAGSGRSPEWIMPRRAVWLVGLVAAGLAVTAAAHEGLQDSLPPITGIHEVADNLYLLANADPDDRDSWTGGNTAVWITNDGVVLVDTKLAGYGQAILERVRAVTDKPVTTIINTHTHFDHAGSNTEFPDSVSIVAHENTATQMARAECSPVTGCDAFKGENRKYLPDRTYADRLSLFSGSDQVDLYHFGRGHTNGDTLVVFPAARTMHTGDLFPWRGLPFVDVEGSGGSAVDYGATLNKAVAGISGVETVITGHINTPVAWSDFEEFAAFYNHLADAARTGLYAGRSAEETAADYTLPDRFRGYDAEAETVLSIMQHIHAGR